MCPSLKFHSMASRFESRAIMRNASNDSNMTLYVMFKVKGTAYITCNMLYFIEQKSFSSYRPLYTEWPPIDLEHY